jgi:hypothetical protein
VPQVHGVTTPTAADRVFASILLAASEFRTFSTADVLRCADTLQLDVRERTVRSHCNGLASIGILRTVDPGRWRFLDDYDPS